MATPRLVEEICATSSWEKELTVVDVTQRGGDKKGKGNYQGDFQRGKAHEPNKDV
jgi:hypothetical protein